MSALWGYEDFVDTITHLSREQGVTDVQSRSKRSSKIRVHQSKPEEIRHQDDVSPIRRCTQWLLRVAEKAQL